MGCSNIGQPVPEDTSVSGTGDYVRLFADNQNVWMDSFIVAWRKATGNGFVPPEPLTTTTSTTTTTTSTSSQETSTTSTTTDEEVRGVELRLCGSDVTMFIDEADFAVNFNSNRAGALGFDTCGSAFRPKICSFRVVGDLKFWAARACAQNTNAQRLGWLVNGSFSSKVPDTFDAADGLVTVPDTTKLYLEIAESAPQCPVGQVMHWCRPCHKTCKNPNPICPRICAQGCGCPKKKMWSDELGRCVRPRKCKRLQGGARRLAFMV